MRRGRATRPHPSLRCDDTGRRFVSRAIIVHLTGEPVRTVRRHLTAVACDVATRSALYDYEQAQAWAKSRPPRPRGEDETGVVFSHSVT